jgi:magnesium-transporting ATPase (P-type)
MSIGFFTNPWAIAGFFAMLLIQLAYTYLPVMNRLFESAPLGLEAWVKIFIMGFIAFLLIETEKVVVAWRKRARGG